MDSATAILCDPATALRLNHLPLLSAGLRALAPAFLFDRSPPRGLGLSQSSFKFLAQFLPGEFAIRRLRTLALHPHFHPGRPMAKADCRRRFIDFLTTRPRPAHKLLLHVGWHDAQGIESRLDLRWKIHLVRSFFLGKLFCEFRVKPPSFLFTFSTS